MATANPTQRPGEKALFLTLWSIIVILIAIWVFWPQSQPTMVKAPDIELGKNVTPIFGSAFVTPTANSDYHVTLQLLPDYVAELGKEERELVLGVRFLGEGSVLEETKVFTKLKANEPVNQILIPNPQRYHPKRLLLYLAH